jgi:spore coat protein CotH
MAWRSRLALVLLLTACEASNGTRGTQPDEQVEPDPGREGDGGPSMARADDAAATADGLRDGAAGAAPIGPGELSTPDGGSAGAAEAGVDLSAELYDPARFPRFDLELPDTSVATLNQVMDASDPRQNTYVSGTLKYGGETVANIGVRLKGEGSFQKLDRKPAFKLKFDEFVDDQSFRGLRRMTLNNAFEDPSFVAERLAYDLFRAAGLPAPRCNNATLYVNGAFYGVYVNVETEDKTFLRRWFASDDGNLYEEGQQDFVPGAETAFNLETNETANDRSDLRALIAELEAATEPGTFLEDLPHLDTAQFLKFTAAEAAVNQWDMYAYTVFYVNNFRIYDDPRTNKFVFIPWGMDLSMKPFRDSRKPYIELFGLARQGDRDNGAVTTGLLFQRCLKSPSCKGEYENAVREIIRVYEELALEARANAYYAQIRDRVLEDRRKRVCCTGGTLSTQQFEAAFQDVLTTIRGRVAALRAELEAD